MPQSPREVVLAFHRAFVTRDLDGLCALYAEDAVNHQVAEAPLVGKAAIRAGFAAFFQAFPDETTEVVQVLEAGEWGIWEWKGGFAGMPADAPVIHGCGFFHVRDGRIVLQRGYWDRLSFLRAHGLPIPESDRG